jgi:hypothetical protein
MVQTPGRPYATTSTFSVGASSKTGLDSVHDWFAFIPQEEIHEAPTRRPPAPRSSKQKKGTIALVLKGFVNVAVTATTSGATRRLETLVTGMRDTLSGELPATNPADSKRAESSSSKGSRKTTGAFWPAGIKPAPKPLVVG